MMHGKRVMAGLLGCLLAALMVPAMAFAADGEIDRIDVGGLSYPVEGVVPGKAATITPDGVDIVDDETFWLRYDSLTEGLSETYADDTSVDGNPARAGESYVLKLSLKAAPGYSFADGLKLYCNGNELPVYTGSTFPSHISPLDSYAGLRYDGTLIISLGSAALAPGSSPETTDAIDRIDIDGIDMPKAGATPSKAMTVKPTGLKIDADQSFWVRFDPEGKELHDTYEDTGNHVDDEPYREGLSYFLKLELSPDDGYSLDPDVKMYYKGTEIAMVPAGSEPDFSKSFATVASDGSSVTAWIFAGETLTPGGPGNEGGGTSGIPEPDDKDGSIESGSESEGEAESSDKADAKESNQKAKTPKTGDVTLIASLVAAVAAIAGIAVLVARRKFA